MSWLSFDTLKNLWGNWSLLAAATIVTAVVWFLADGWLIDPAVAAIRNQYCGYYGSAAIVLATIISTKLFLIASQRSWCWVASIPERRRRAQQQAEVRAKILQKLPRFPDPDKKLLDSCVKAGNPKFELPPDDVRVRRLFESGVISCLDYEKDLSTFVIYPWVWSHLEVAFRGTT
jgi:hypothetical protein